MVQAPVTAARRVERRCWRFSLRGLLLLVLAAAIVFAGLGWRWRRAQRQAAIVEQLRATGIAGVMYDYQIHTSDEGYWGRLTVVPRWLRNLLGDDFFSEVHELAIGPGSNVATAPADGWKTPLGTRRVSEGQCRQALELAASFSQVRSLSIHDAVVRRDALENLTCWEQLSDLRIDGCDVRDEDLAPLSRAVSVRSLHLNRQPIGDAALAHMRSMKRLRVLGLGVTNVTDEGLAELAYLPELTSLWLFQNAGISNRGMINVGRCAKLRFLEISSTGVGDRGLQELRSLDELRYLNASKTLVTDSGLKHLAKLAMLEEGLFFGTVVTQAGVDQIPSLVKSGSYITGKGWPKTTGTTAAGP